MYLKHYLIFIALVFQVESSPISESEEGVDPWALKFYDDDDPNGNNSSISDVALELGVTQDFLIQLKENWEKAIESEKERNKEVKLRQGGDGLGEFFGLGGGGPGNSQGGFGFGGGQGGDEEDDEEDAPPVNGPGVAGVLTGLFGIFSGIGGLNPQRVVQSTVNFFPPDQRVAAQMALDAAFGGHLNATTLSPLTDAPPRNSTKNKSSNNTMSLNATSIVPLELTTIEPAVVMEVTTRKKFIFKETSLLEDFEEAVFKFTPAPPTEPPAKEKTRTSSLEKDFADTADLFKLPEKNETREEINSFNNVNNATTLPSADSKST